jgi:hypothetical protein
MGFAPGITAAIRGRMTWDLVDTALSIAKPWMTKALDTDVGGDKWTAMGDMPIIGSLVNGMQAGYELGSAAYDGVTGDRDGVVYHGTKGAMNLVSMIPGVSSAMSTANEVLAVGGNGLRLAGHASGNKGPRMDKSIEDRGRDARMARREEGEYSTYLTDEQRSQPGWIGREDERVVHSQALATSDGVVEPPQLGAPISTGEALATGPDRALRQRDRSRPPPPSRRG